MISTETDTIHHHRSDETLQERENYLETIFNSVQTGLLVIDPETHSILDVNPAAAELIGLDRCKIGRSKHHFRGVPFLPGALRLTSCNLARSQLYLKSRR